MCAHENRTGRYASFYAPVKDFLEFDSISTIRRSPAVGWQQTNAARRFVDTYHHHCVHPNPMIGCDDL
jgi:hypothetical protein